MKVRVSMPGMATIMEIVYSSKLRFGGKGSGEGNRCGGYTCGL